MISHRRLLAAVTLALGISGTAMAQFHEQGVVSGTGVVTISRPTETMRLQIAIMGRGATLKDALKALKERVEDAKGELEDLGADKATIKVESSKIMEVQNNPQQQMQMMMMQRMKQAGKASKRATVATPVIVTAMLTAEWKLTAKDPEELLLAVNPLQEKIKAADLSGSKEADKLTPEQEELMEEMQETYGYNMNDEQKPGQPAFLFVSRISEAERDKALAEAFEKAKQQATRLAKAAGAQLGALKSLAGNAAMGGGDYDVYQYGRYNSPSHQMMQAMRNRQSSGEEETVEAIGAEPGPVSINVSVTAAFDLAGKK